jgi:hypothetical protein
MDRRRLGSMVPGPSSVPPWSCSTAMSMSPPSTMESGRQNELTAMRPGGGSLRGSVPRVGDGGPSGRLRWLYPGRQRLDPRSGGGRLTPGRWWRLDPGGAASVVGPLGCGGVGGWIPGARLRRLDSEGTMAAV